jgi:hypothetical protein
VGHEDTGSLSLAKRLERLEENDRAIAEDCEQNNRKLWEQVDALKQEQTGMKIGAAKSEVRLTIVIGILVFLATFASTYVSKRLDPPTQQSAARP